MEQQLEPDYSAFRAQKEEKLKLVFSRREKFDFVKGILLDQLLNIDLVLDNLSSKLDLFLGYQKQYSQDSDTNNLIQVIHSVRRDSDFIRRSSQKTSEEALYSMQLNNLSHFKENIEQLRKFEEQLRKIKSGPAQEKMPEVFDLLRKTILPGDMIDKGVIDFLLDDVIELREIMEGIYEELSTFKAICALIESFPRELIDQMLEDSTPTQ